MKKKKISRPFRNRFVFAFCLIQPVSRKNSEISQKMELMHKNENLAKKDQNF